MLKEQIEQKIVEMNSKKIKGYFSKNLLTSYSLLIMFIFDVFVFIYSLFVSIDFLVISILIPNLLLQFIFFVTLLPKMNISNRSANFIYYVIVYSIPNIAYFYLMVIHPQIFEVFIFSVRLILIIILLVDVKIEHVNQVLLGLSIVVALTINIFLISNETLSGRQNFSRRVRFSFDERANAYKITTIDNGFSNRIVIPNTHNGKKVYMIENGAFKNIQNISAVKEIVLPSNVIKVADDAFTSCKNPVTIIAQSTSIDFGNSLSKCEGLKMLEFPNGVELHYDFSFLENATNFQIGLPINDLFLFKDNIYIKNRVVPIINKDELYVNFYDHELLLDSQIIKLDNGKYEVSEPDHLKLAQNPSDYFFGWYDNPEFNGESIVFPIQIDNSISLYGKYLSTYHISLHLNENEINTISIKNFHEESGMIKLDKVEKDGCIFDGWYDNEQYQGQKIEYIDSTIRKNISLYAKMNPIVYNIDYDFGLSNVTHPELITEYTIFDEDIILPEISSPGYSFNGWYDQKNGGNKITSLKTSYLGNQEVYAQWQIIEYEITFNNLLDGDANNDPYYTIIGGKLNDATRTGYDFVGWYFDEKFSGQKVTDLAGNVGDVILFARWEHTNYTLTLKNIEGITDSNFNDTYNYTIETPTFDLPKNLEKAGYTFMGWYDQIQGGQKFQAIAKGTHENTQLYARWQLVEYNINYHLDDVDLEPMESDTYTIVDEVNLKQPTQSPKFKKLKGWYLTDDIDTKIEKIESGTIGDIDVFAKWEYIEYRVEYVSLGTATQTICDSLNSNTSYTNFTFENPIDFNQIKSDNVGVYNFWIYTSPSNLTMVENFANIFGDDFYNHQFKDNDGSKVIKIMVIGS